MPPATLSDDSFSTKKERAAIASWAQARARCTSVENQFGNTSYRLPLQRYALDAENRIVAAIVGLHDTRNSFGEFNRKRQIVDDETSEKVEALNQKASAQRVAQERADRQARERIQFQQAIENAEQEASIARQQAEDARNEAENAKQRKRPDATPSTYSEHMHPELGYLRFGTRSACTDW